MAETNYSLEAYDDALSTIENFEEEIAEQLEEKGEASSDLNNDYPNGDSYHHENHVDKSYSLREAADVLEQLSEHEADDPGLWEGLEPRRAIEAMAAYTYGNAVYADWVDLIEELNQEAVEALLAPEGPKDWSPYSNKKGKGMKPLTFVRAWLKGKRA